MINDKAVNELTIDDWIKVPKNEQIGLHMEYIGTGGIKTIDEMKHRIECFIHINNLRFYPVSLQELNRRFGKPARELKVSVKDVVMGMLHANVLDGHMRIKACVFATTSYMKDRAATFDFGWIDDIHERAESVKRATEKFWNSKEGVETD